MNIAVVGGGTRCKRLINVIDRHAFEEIDPRIVAVADIKEDAPGLARAKSKGCSSPTIITIFLIGMTSI